MAKGGTKRAKDLFAQKATIETTSADISTLRSQDHDTGLSIRGGLAWLVHKVSFWLLGSSYFPSVGEADASQTIELGLMTRKGLAAMPWPGDDGLIDYWFIGENIRITTSGGWQTIFDQPREFHHLPPLPLAAPNLTLYVKAGAAWTGQAICELEFTTMPLDEAMYTEIAETWGW